MMRKLTLRDRQIRQITSTVLAVLVLGIVGFLGVRLFNFSKAAVAAGTMYVTPVSGTWRQGDPVSVTIRENSGSSPILQATAFVTFNPNQLQYVGFTETGDFNFVAPAAPTCTPIAVAPDCKSAAGTVRIIRGKNAAAGSTTAVPLTGDHGIITLNFKALTGSGTTDVLIDKANSGFTGSDGVNKLLAVNKATFTLTPAVITDASMSTSPATGNVKTGDTVSVKLLANSPTQKIQSAHVVLNWSPAQLTYLDTTDSPSFPNPSQTNATAGKLDLIRSAAFAAGGTGGVLGSSTIATVNFKVTGTTGTIPITIARASGSADSGLYNGDGANVLRAGASPGSVYTVVTTTTDPPPPPPPGDTTPPAGNDDDPGNGNDGNNNQVYRGNTRATSSGDGNVSLDGDGLQVSGEVDLTPQPDSDILSEYPGDTIKKVEYLLNKKLVATKTSEPFTYTIDTKKLKNGTYNLTIKTTYSSGAVDSQTNKLIVKNPVTISYVMAHYGAGIFGTILGLVIVAFLLWRFVWPRFGGGSGGMGDYATYPTYGNDPDAGAYNEYEAPDPSTVAPTDVDSGMAAGQSAMYDSNAGQVVTPQPVAPAAPQATPVTEYPQAPVAPQAVQPVQPVQPIQPTQPPQPVQGVDQSTAPGSTISPQTPRRPLS